MDSSAHTSCKNCESDLFGNYCSNCGQSAHTHRYSMGHIGHEVFHSLTHTDKGAFELLKQLIVKPGYVALELFEGKRKRYFNLFTFLILSIGIFTLSVNSAHYFDAMRKGTVDMPGRATIMKDAFSLMANNSKLLSFTMVPITAFLTWLLFRKKKYNFAEHLVFNTVIFTVYILFMALTAQFVRINWQLVNYINNVNQVSWLIYMSIGCRQLFRNNWFATILKTLLIRVLQITAIWILAVLAVIAQHWF